MTSPAVDCRPYEFRHLAGVVRLCEDEGWPSLPADPQRAHRILTNPGVTARVALARREEVLGFIYVLSDGEVQAYVASMAVARGHRRRGIGTALIRSAFAACGAERLDLLSVADEFYASLPHRRWSGFRLYPRFSEEEPEHDARPGSD